VAGVDRTRSYLLECYWPGISEERIVATAHRTRKAAAALRRQGAAVDFLSSILIPVDETVFWLFEGLEADIRMASLHAGVPFERVLESMRFDGRPRPRTKT
jgi:hypothetical protein